MKKQTCPRRMQDWGPWERETNLDYWRRDRTCSFCGSLEPEYVLDILTKGAVIGPTDKNYKIYLAYHRNKHMKFYFQHFDVDQQMRFIGMMNDKSNPLVFGYEGGFYVLPFFVKKEVGNVPDHS